MSKTILIMAGGTGGHIFPALAVAEHLKAEGLNVVWLGNQTGMESRLVPQYGYPIRYIRFGGVRGKGWLPKLALPFNLLYALCQTLWIFLQVRPAMVLGMGGYITIPGGLIAKLLVTPLVIHEQNSIAGMANRFLATLTQHVLMAFPSALPSGKWVGNPIRYALANTTKPESRYAERTGPLNILVVGGSLGAQVLNKVVPQALGLLAHSLKFSVTHQSGLTMLEDLRANYAKNNVPVNAVSFIDDMHQAYMQADLIICRAGAMTVAEVAAVGVAALFVPYPYAVDDHQKKNALFLVEQSAALSIDQKDLTAEKLANTISLMSREQLKGLAMKARKLSKPDAAKKVSGVCLSLVM